MNSFQPEPEVRRRGVSKPGDVVVPVQVDLVGGTRAGVDHDPPVWIAIHRWTDVTTMTSLVVGTVRFVTTVSATYPAVFIHVPFTR